MQSDNVNNLAKFIVLVSTFCYETLRDLYKFAFYSTSHFI
jgi:hypothetical protein